MTVNGNAAAKTEVYGQRPVLAGATCRPTDLLELNFIAPTVVMTVCSTYEVD